MRARLDGAVIDSSALLCIALAEPAAACFLDGFSRTDRLCIGAATRAQTWLAVHNAKGPAGAQKIDELLEALNVELVDFSTASLPHFRQGGATYHHKFHDKARLNIGDLFTYSLAKQLDLPLFFQGMDFMHTDLATWPLLLRRRRSFAIAGRVMDVPAPVIRFILWASCSTLKSTTSSTVASERSTCAKPTSRRIRAARCGCSRHAQ